MYESRKSPGAKGADTATSTSSAAEATLNDQLARDTTGKLRDEVLDELAVAADSIEVALDGNVSEPNARVLRDLLAAIRLGETIVSETWSSVHA